MSPIPVWTEPSISGGTAYIIFGGVILPVTIDTIVYTEQQAPMPVYTGCSVPDSTYTPCSVPLPPWTEIEF